MIVYYGIAIWAVKLFRGFQHLNFECSQKLISKFTVLFNEKMEAK